MSPRTPKSVGESPLPSPGPASPPAMPEPPFTMASAVSQEPLYWHGQQTDVEGGGTDKTGSPNSLQLHLVAATGEFLGTFLFLWMAYAGHLMIAGQADLVAMDGGPGASTIIYISLVYSFSLMVNVWAFFRVSGGMFNPAVTVGLVLSGAVPVVRGAVVIPAQLLASICAGFLAEAMLPFEIHRVNTTLGPGVTTPQGLFIEMFLTAELVLVILMLAVEKSKTSFLAPVGIGLALLVAEMAGVYYTGGSLNPARSLGCAVASKEFVGYHWIYWLGPLMGGCLASGYHKVIKMLQYEKANPGQDGANGGFVHRDGF